MFQYPCKCARCRSPPLPSSPRKHKFSPNHLLSQPPSRLLLLSHPIKFSRRSCLARAYSLSEYRDCSSLTSLRLCLTRLSPSFYSLSPPLPSSLPFTPSLFLPLLPHSFSLFFPPHQVFPRSFAGCLPWNP